MESLPISLQDGFPKPRKLWACVSGLNDRQAPGPKAHYFVMLLLRNTPSFVEGVAGFCDVVDSERVRSATALRNKVAAAGGVGTRGLALCRAVRLGPSCGHGRAGYGRAIRVFNGDDSVHADLVVLHQRAGEVDARAAQRGGG